MSLEEEIRQLRTQVVSLTERVYRLEQRNTTSTQSVAPPPISSTPSPQENESAAPVTPISAPVEMPRQSPPYKPYIPPPQMPRSGEHSLERTIGSQWLNRVGIVAVLIGVSYFLKLAFENGWIGPGLRVLIGLLAGAALIWWSERFRRTGADAFSYSLKAVGIGTLYLSLWASFQQYHLVNSTIAFIGMILVTAMTTWLALRQHAGVLAGLALLGGYLTPILISTGENHEAALLSYLLLLSVGAVVLQRFEHWPGIVLGAWLGTTALYFAWNNSYYASPAFNETVFFLSAFFIVFAAAPFLATYSGATDDTRTQLFAFIAMLNGGVFFVEVRNLMTNNIDHRSAGYAIGLAAIYFGLGTALRRREQDAPANGSLMWMIHQGLALSFLTLAIALRLDGRWITFTWLIEAGALLYAAARARQPVIKSFGGVVLILAIGKLLLLDCAELPLQPLFFNQRFGLFLLSIAVLAMTFWLERETDDENPIQAIAVSAINILALCALLFEVHDFFGAQIANLEQTVGSPGASTPEYALRAAAILRDFTYSAVLMVYGVGLMIVGFRYRSAFLRWQAIFLVGITIAKVFFYDMSNLDRAYRVASFIILGVILLAISYAYQKDWLGLQKGKD
jgi:uncharacterized membrane protein